MTMDDSGSKTSPDAGQPILPIRDTSERIIESPQTQAVLDRRQIGKFQKRDTTPDVANVEYWSANNTVSTLITKFEKGQPGQHLYIKGDGFTTLQHGTWIFMTGGADLLLAANMVYHFVAYESSPLKFYQVVAPAGGGGGVASFAGRVGVVAPLQADYDGFFLTPAEGNAAYSLLGHTHPLPNELYNFMAAAALSEVGVDDWTVPGPSGSAGVAGVAGAPGAAGNTIIIQEEIPPDDWPIFLQGPKGDTGAAGAPGSGGGSVIYQLVAEEATPDDWAGPPGIVGGVSGSGTIGTIPKFTGASTLGNSIISESAGTITIAGAVITTGSIVTQSTSGILMSSAQPILRWEDTDEALDTKVWRLYSQTGTIRFETVNDAGSAASGVWAVSRVGNVPGAFSLSVPLAFSTDATLDIGATAARARDIFVTRVSDGAVATGTLLNSSGTALQHGIGSGWASQTFYTGGTLRWTLDNTVGIMIGAAGAYIFDSTTKKVLAADQATFVNAQTNITGLSFAAGINQVWDVDISLSVTMAVAATGVMFYWTGPAGATGELHLEGNIATIVTWQSLYQAVITVPGTFFVTGIITGRYRMKATLRTAGTAGTFQLVGITGGATTTCAVKKGSSMLATRTT